MRRLSLFVLISFQLQAFPSSLFWTVVSTDVQETGKLHTEVDTYFDLFRMKDHLPFFPPNYGLELGVFNYRDIKGEAGFDYTAGTKSPFFFNGKIGFEEEKLFSHAPSFSSGIYLVGTDPHETAFNVFHAEIGKRLPKWLGGRVFAGVYRGNKKLRHDQRGFMVGFEYPFCLTKDCEGIEFYRFSFNADYASGKNAIGGGGACFYYYFTPNINVQTGPTFFNDASIYGKWKWTVLVNIDFPLTKGCPSSKDSNKDKIEEIHR